MADRTHGAELAALTAIAAQVNCTQDLDEILRGALETTLDVVGVDAGEIYLIREDTGELVLRAQLGLSESFVADEAVIAPGDCLCGVAAMSEQVLVAVDIAAHAGRTRPACLRDGFSSLHCLPLRARGQVLGLLNVQSRRPRLFLAADEELLTAIGNQIGIAVANARLIEDAELRRATLDSVMHSLVDGLILLDRRGRIAFANPCAEDMLNQASQALVGQTPETIDETLVNNMDGASPLSSPLRDAAAGAERRRITELSLVRPKGRILQVQGFHIHNVEGEDLGLGLLLRDVTREKELDRMKSQLLATVSHELRTPLASIKGFATTLLREDVQWDEASRREFLSIIDEESDRLSELISNLLDMSRIEAGTLRVELEPTFLSALIQETAAESRVMSRAHDISIALPPSLPAVWADPRRIRQVLRNLVENAVKYSPQGGVITITALALADSVQVSVADQGLGIPPEHIGHIFDRFYQVDSASTRRIGGTGLGLSICRAIIEAHHGRIWAESQPGVGSTFLFTLPVAEAAQPG